jgi:predicted DCC family thiol-disulfide oxidoreductase YuxK
METFEHVVLYDGECNLCAAIVQFTIRRDKRGVLRYAALQSESGRKLLQEHDLPGAEAASTFVFIEDGRAYVRSAAALRLVRHLSGGWPVLSVLELLPRWLRDPVYSYVAKHRYRWFGKKAQCMLMKPEYRERFYP